MSSTKSWEFIPFLLSVWWRRFNKGLLRDPHFPQVMDPGLKESVNSTSLKWSDGFGYGEIQYIWRNTKKSGRSMDFEWKERSWAWWRKQERDLMGLGEWRQQMVDEWRTRTGAVGRNTDGALLLSQEGEIMPFLPMVGAHVATSL